MELEDVEGLVTEVVKEEVVEGEELCDTELVALEVVVVVFKPT